MCFMLSCFFIALQFEGGLYTTAKVVYATYALSEFLGKAPAITEVWEISKPFELLPKFCYSQPS